MHCRWACATYRKGGWGKQIRYAIVDSPLGKLLIAGTDRGLCAITFGDNEEELERALPHEFPAAELHGDASGLSDGVRAIIEHLRGRQPQLALPLNIQATAFQWRVWQELMKIPYGKTRSYSEVARAIGQPKAVRAVARACATNPVPIVIPCHRVIRRDGSLGGYGGGIGRKIKLLEQERKGARKPGERR